ncbi:MAG: alpha-L-fucosidase [Acidobacteria bacterium]|nr:alpha-L-fucosidase [Acidobacteriota bacterium]
MKTKLLGIVFFCAFPLTAWCQTRPYQPSWASLNQRPVPQWYDQAKFGIFIHWGVYSVPAFADPHAPDGEAYAEWYWYHMHNKNGPTWAFHARTYGADFHYQDFVSQFTAKLFDPAQWADLFVRSGARYVVLTAKHHEGFCLWPCPASWNWNSVDVGPHQDLAGELSKAVVARGLKMGFYYSLYEWYDPLYLHHPRRYVTEHMLPQMKDLVDRYHPSILWTDGEWEHPSSFWKSTQFLAWLYNDSPVKDEIVVNDRWGSETRGHDGGFYTSEYGKVNGKNLSDYSGVHKWEEDQGIGRSFGYNRMETATDYKSATQLIHLLVDTVSKGGDFLLDIGPTADGRIPVIMQERLLQIGQWLKVNGEAIYSTRPWRQSAEGDVRYTTRDGAVYAIAESWPGRELVLTAPKPTRNTAVTLLGPDTPLKWREAGGKLHIELPAFSPEASPLQAAFVFRLTGVN